MSVPREAGRRDPAWVRGVDAAVDATLVAFAAWTLWYELALWQQWSLWGAARVWIVLLVFLLAWVVPLRLRSGPVPHAGRHGPVDAARPPALGVAVVALVVGTVTLARHQVGILPALLLGLVVLAAQLHAVRARVPVRGRSTLGTEAPSLTGPSSTSHLLAGAGCLGLAVLASLLLDPNEDDVYYVNRATWVAQHGVPLIRDTMFGPGDTTSAYGGGPPLASFEALQGGLAHAVGLSAPTMVYVVMVPVLAAASGWALWRLVRTWARGWHLAVLVVAVAFLALNSTSVFGSYSLGRIWQGKVVAVAVLLPLVWVHLSRLVDRKDRWSLWMLAVCGVAFVGLSSTAELLAPVLLAAGLLAALVARSVRVALGALVFAVSPVLAGLLVASGSAVQTSEPVLSRAAAFELVFGSTAPMVVLAVLGLVLGPALVRGPARVVAAAGSIATLAAFVPGVFELVDVVTGAGPVVWRLAIGSPVAVLVGVLLTWPLTTWAAGTTSRFRRAQGSAPPGQAASSRRTTAGSVTAVVVVLAMVAAASPVWTAEGQARLAAPGWKLPTEAVGNVRAVSDLDPEPGRWLLPPPEMQALATTSTEHFAVVPRIYYLAALRVSPEDRADRSRLFGFVSGIPLPARKVRRALEHLDVSVACLPADATSRARRTMSRATRSEERPVGSMLCHLPGSSAGGGGRA